jgi:PPOX class probable F420-dependent enzyme
MWILSAGSLGLGATPEDNPPATCEDVQIMRIPNSECRRRAGAAAVARLATTGSDLRPHLVPVTFAFTGDHIVIAIDSKPKTTTRLRRLRNIDENPRVCLLWDEYDDDWSQLWWVRADATARVETSGPSCSTAVEALCAKYPQYALDAPRGPVIRIAVSRWTGWAATGHFPGPGRPGGFPR